MTGSWHGGKGSDPRPEAEPGAYARGFDAIDWNARAAVALRELITGTMRNAGYFTEVEVSHQGGSQWEINFPTLGLSVGGIVSERRTLDDLARIATERAIEALAT